MTHQHFFFIVMISVFSSCGQPNKQEVESTVKGKLEKTDSSEVKKDYQTSPLDNIDLVRQFAENYLPDTTSSIGNMVFPDSVIRAFKAIRMDRSSQEKYLTLLYLKIYRGQLQCCHQSYELRKMSASIYDIKGIDSTANPLLYEYNLITKTYRNDRRLEFVSSAIAAAWLEKNQRLLKYEKIKVEHQKILALDAEIERELRMIKKESNKN